MADLLDLSARIIDDGLDEPNNRITNELSEVAEGVAMVESFSHCVAVDTGEGLVAFDASHTRTGGDVVRALQGWTSDAVTHLVYTHGHADHVGGSPAFAAAYGAPSVIGHDNVAVRFDRYNTTNAWNLAVNARQFGGVRGNIPMGGEDRDDRRFIPADVLVPDQSFSSSHSISVGAHDIEFHHARGETDDHLWGWIDTKKWLFTGDFVIWNFPNAGNPQKVQRYPIEWAEALRAMIAKGPELLLPAHGLPIAGKERIATVLGDIAGALEDLVSDVLEMMNNGEDLDSIIHSVRVPEDTLAKPYLRPMYDEPEFVVRNVWRQFGGWWDLAPSRLKPSPDAVLASAVVELAGGTAPFLSRALAAADDADLRLACHLADLAAWAAPDDPEVHGTRADIYWRRRKAERSLMSKGIFAAAARESEAVSGKREGRPRDTRQML